MANKSTLNYTQAAQLVSDVVDQQASKYCALDGSKSYAYSAGFLQSMVANMLLDMSPARQQHYINVLKGE